MPKRKDLRVIPGGKSDGSPPPPLPQPPESFEVLMARVDHYRGLTDARSNSEISNLIDDMKDAIEALALLEKSPAISAPKRMIEYRRLIADLEIEIVSALER